MRAFLVASSAALLVACGAPAEPKAPASRAPASAPPASGTSAQVGLATWYGKALAGHKTASGERFDPERYTAAHRTLPLGTWVLVTRTATGKSVRVRINDRGPFGDARRIIDLSQRAADDLGIVRAGVAEVEVRVIPPP